MSVNLSTRNQILLRCRDLYRVSQVHPGDALACDEGILWITQTGDAGDYVLRPGESMTVKRRGPVLVQAMRDAAFHVA